MAEYPIAKSFKGILRISPIQELLENKVDEIFNPSYYNFIDTPKAINSDKSVDGQISVIAEASSVLANNSVKRFNSGDEFINQKLPITDSMGNFLNISLGHNSVVFGTKYVVNIDTPTTGTFTFTDIEGKTITENIDSETILTNNFYFGLGPRKYTKKNNIKQEEYSRDNNPRFDLLGPAGGNESYIIVDNKKYYKNAEFITIRK